MAIIFYDIASRENKTWSPNTWRTRLCLNYKKLEYRTEWVEYPDIENHCKTLGIPPTSERPDGSARYTLPAIHDLSTGAYIADSFAIAEYLDNTYPYAPKLFPRGTAARQAPFEMAFRPYVRILWGFFMLQTCSKLNPVSSEYYRKVVESRQGRKLEEIDFQGAERVEQWGNFKENMTKVAAWYASNGGKGPFILGEEPSWADLVVVAYMKMLTFALGEDSTEWKDIEMFDNGRWKTLCESLSSTKKSNSSVKCPQTHKH